MNGDIFAGTVDIQGILFRSVDNGNNWEESNQGLQNRWVQNMAFNSQGQLFAATNDFGIFTSTDNGDTWTQSGLENIGVSFLAVNGNDEIFAANNGAGILMSSDHGKTWSPRNSGLANAGVLCLAGNANGDIFTGINGSGALRISNHGDSWEPINTGLRNELHIRAFAFDGNGNIFAGADNISSTGGIFRSTDNGDNWNRLEGELEFGYCG